MTFGKIIQHLLRVCEESNLVHSQSSLSEPFVEEPTSLNISERFLVTHKT